jgi:hypothetical protein
MEPRLLIMGALRSTNANTSMLIPQNLDPEILADHIRYTKNKVEYFHMGRKIGESSRVV